MKPDEYLEKNKLLQKEFADMLGKSKVYVHRLIKGAIPTKEDMELIVRVTNGEIQPNDFYDLPEFLNTPNTG